MHPTYLYMCLWCEGPHLPGHIFTSVTVAKSKTGQDPRVKSCCRGHGGLLLTGLLIMAYLDCLLVGSRTTCPGIAPHRVNSALYCQSILKKMSYR